MEEKEKPRIGPGFRVGSLEVIAPTEQRKNAYTVWLCCCDCGGQISLDTRTLQRGTVRDCGCITKARPGQRDLTGQRFGKLVAVKPTQHRTPKGAVVWLCRCDCGNEVLAPLPQLTQGYKKSCGCLGNPPVKDNIGKRFGQLTVTGYWGKKDGMHRWECTCDCGKTTIAGQTQLQSGKTKSCGCLQAKMVTENMKFVDGTSVTRLEKAGKRLVSTNTSGYTGVYFNRRTQKWTAQIGFKGKLHYLGSYSKIEDAVKARQKAENRIYGEFLEWYYDMHPEKESPDAEAARKSAIKAK